MASESEKVLEGLALGALLVGGIALLGAALQPKRRDRLIVAGVDMTDVDPNRPFAIDFSPRVKSTHEKAQAIERMRYTMDQLGRHFPLAFSISADSKSGRYVLNAIPLPSIGPTSSNPFGYFT